MECGVTQMGVQRRSDGGEASLRWGCGVAQMGLRPFQILNTDTGTYKFEPIYRTYILKHETYLTEGASHPIIKSKVFRMKRLSIHV
jgi:hypothetical protein